MSNKVLVVVDMQNDFITGALANTEGQKIIPAMVDYIKNFDGDIVATLDTHYDNYLETMEGKKLPVPHCIKGTEGWKLVPEIVNAFNAFDTFKGKTVTVFKKETFGSTDLADYIADFYDANVEIEICGVCTDICVISNALVIKATTPNRKITVLKDLCAGVTPESHETALKAMAACHIDIV